MLCRLFRKQIIFLSVSSLLLAGSKAWSEDAENPEPPSEKKPALEIPPSSKEEAQINPLSKANEVLKKTIESGKEKIQELEKTLSKKPEEEDPSSEETAENPDSPSPEEAPQEQLSQESSETLIEIKTLSPPYIYDPLDKKDPFSKPGALKTVETDPKERIHPVEQESIENIQLRAIIWGKDGITPRALFETQDKKAYTLTQNDRLGSESALIYKIESDRVWAMKPFVDPTTGLTGFEPYEKTLRQVGSEANTGGFFYER